MRRRTAALILVAVALTALVATPAALAAAGGGSAGFSGGGGGGGGHGSGFALYILIDLLIHIAVLGHGLGALVLIGLALLYFFATKVLPAMQASWAGRAGASAPRRHNAKRERRVELAAAEAAEDDPDFAPDRVQANARRLFFEIQKAWDTEDRVHLRGLVSQDLMAEWERRLDDLDRRGWRNHVQPLGEPTIEYVGLTHKGDADTDRVVVRIDARLKDYVIDSYGRHLKRTGRLGETTRMREFWTLQRRGGHWVLASIEQAAEGSHSLQEQIVATPWADERGMRDEALIEGAVADAVPEGTEVSEVADLQFDGDAQAAANDLSLADGRFAPDVLEVAVRRTVDAWALAIDGDDAILTPIATPEAARELLYVNDHTRVVVRGPEVKRIRIVGLDAGAEPPTMTVEVDLTGRRYLEDRDTTAVVAGSRSKRSSFTERWTLSLNGDAAEPWRITSAAAPVGLI